MYISVKIRNTPGIRWEGFVGPNKSPGGNERTTGECAWYYRLPRCRWQHHEGRGWLQLGGLAATWGQVTGCEPQKKYLYDFGGGSTCLSFQGVRVCFFGEARNFWGTMVVAIALIGMGVDRARRNSRKDPGGHWVRVTWSRSTQNETVKSW